VESASPAGDFADQGRSSQLGCLKQVKRRTKWAARGEPSRREIGLSARLVDKNGKVIAAILFEDNQTFEKVEPPAAVAAFDEAFVRIAQEMISWTIRSFQAGHWIQHLPLQAGSSNLVLNKAHVLFRALFRISPGIEVSGERL
jgi:hypothetical protein